MNTVYLAWVKAGQMNKGVINNDYNHKTMGVLSKDFCEYLNLMEIASRFSFDPIRANIEKRQKRFKVGTAINLAKTFLPLVNVFFRCLLIMNSMQSLKTKTYDLQMVLTFSSYYNLQFPNWQICFAKISAATFYSKNTLVTAFLSILGVPLINNFTTFNYTGNPTILYIVFILKLFGKCSAF